MSSTKFPVAFAGAWPCKIAPNEYQHLALRTESTPVLNHYEDNRQLDRLQHAAYGFCTEAGEFMDPLKRVQFYQKAWAGKTQEEFLANLREEVGDMLWYCALAADALDSSLQEIMLANVRKLQVRYPNKFTCENAITRDTMAEQAAMNLGTQDVQQRKTPE